MGVLESFLNCIKEIKESLNLCANPDQAFSYFERFLENTTAKITLFEILKASKFYCDLLFDIFAQSNTLSLLLINHNEYFYWLLEELAANKTKLIFKEEIDKFIKSKKTLDEKKYLLREYRKKEYLRIASKEISKICKSHEIYTELSELADACLEVALDIAFNEEGFKDRNLCIISMGKLGARELNFSSDIDIIFVHDNANDTQNYFKVAQDVVSIISDVQFGSFVFRVDTRLRPFGNNSSLSLSVDEYENYYFSFGQVWEKFALTRARFSAGDIGVAKKFFSVVRPFVYTKNIDISYIEDVRSMRYKIKLEKLSNYKNDVIEPLKINVKLGLGGIREVEFITQYFQLIYAGKDTDLQTNSTLEALDILYDKGYLKQARKLKACYLFLRLVEHKIQLKDEKQTADLPLNKEELEIFAKKFGLKTSEFLKIYNKITDTVHEIYKTIFYAHNIPIFSPIESLEGFFEEEFSDYKQISIQLSDIARKSKFAKSNPALLSAAIDTLYKRFKSMAKSLNSRLFLNVLSGFNSILPNYYDTFFGNKRIFETATLAFALGLHQKLDQYSFLVDEFFYIDQPLEILELTKQEKERLEFNVALKLLSGKLDKKSKKILSVFAQNFIKHLIEKLEIKDLIVLAYGKLGIEELFINSDLDLVFLAKSVDDKKISEVSNLVKELNKLYSVDLRLRPFGEKGLIASEIDYFKTYLLKYAKDWEKLAIQKARIIYSDVECDLKDSITEFARFIDKKSIRDMKNLIEAHKGFDIKNAKGGIVDIEFILQLLCIQNGCFKFGRSIEEMIGEISQIKEVRFLKAVYIYFSKILNLTRLIPNDIKYKLPVLEFLLKEDNLEGKIKKLQQKVSGIFNAHFLLD
ncbi:hypothetical protein [Desulfurella amilsii]|uniref:[protein-PII] uridylyltransferase family protein n=1 Tax=Desulfurella amilsii TaxID=1562698 RepID=UPI0013022283|nr:hypothetical protein [Desulfurella amilsii]